ncbi:hypothetical protein NQ318_022143 [Aromia moschata]|uniref:Capsid protein n=1 Tax=Aromia moschata TaxID=1265417 RepID=A0AAV8Z5I4_9CUCU|nr:hypothetical protein NQ318_022143 [Aromia moschata]
MCMECLVDKLLECGQQEALKGFWLPINLIKKVKEYDFTECGYRFCGPGTKLSKRLKRGDVGINQLDEACKKHDIAYAELEDVKSRNAADKELAQAAWERVKASDSGFGEKLAALGVTGAMNVKRKLGMGLRKRKKHRKMRGTALKFALHPSVRIKRKRRIIPIPKTGGVLKTNKRKTSLKKRGGGAAGIAKAVNDAKASSAELAEQKRHNLAIEAATKGRGLKSGYGTYLAYPYPKNYRGKSSELTYDFNPPIYLDDDVDYEIGLVNFDSFYSIPNVDDKNNTFLWWDDTNIEHVVKIPTGSYEINNLLEIMQREIEKKDGAASINMDFDNSTSRVRLRTNRKISFNVENSLSAILGFSNKIVDANTKITGEFPVEILKVNAIFIDCNIAAGSFLNGRPVHIIHQFFPAVSPGSNMVFANHAELLDVTDKPYNDVSIENYQYHFYQPTTSGTINYNDEVRIAIQDLEANTVPCDSYLYVEGKLTKDDDGITTQLEFINNAVAYLFKEIRYELNGTVIDSVRDVGLVSTLKGYLSYTPNESSLLENAGWVAKKNKTVAKQGETLKDAITRERIITDSAGNFNTIIPLKHLMGFFEDFRKLMIHMRQELVIIRSSSDYDAVTSENDTEKPKVTINRISWCLILRNSKITPPSLISIALIKKILFKLVPLF